MFFPVMATTKDGIDASHAAMILSQAALAATVSIPVAGHLIDRFRLDPTLVYIVTFGFGSALSLGLPYAPGYALTSAIMAIFLMGDAIHHLTAPMILTRIEGKERLATTYSFTTTFRNVGTMIGPFVFGILLDLNIDNRILWLAWPIPGLLACIFIALTKIG